MTGEPDAQLRRLERNALLTCICLAVVAVGIGGTPALLGALGGSLLIAVSYRAIRAGVTALATAGASGRLVSRSQYTVWRLVKFITRFAILGMIAYVMMVRLRAHPGWMLAGASSLVAAAVLEAIRGLRRARP